jgi:cellulose synthase/poly-beta-1,6-N-acetylglucosamine synthase-like glycosyltransferase
MENLKNEILKKSEIKVLVITPQNEVKNYCSDEWSSRVTNLTYPNYDIMMADNSSTNKNKKKIMKMGIDCIHIKPKHKSNQKYIAESHEALRNYALIRGYHFVLHLESDVIPPHDIIERLLVHRKKVVSAMYFIDFGVDSHLMLQNIENVGGTVKHTTMINEGHDIQIVDGQLHEVYACGLGACLIHRSVLEQIKFRHEEGASAHPDSFFAADLRQLGIKQYLDTSIICDHKNSSWATVTDLEKNID